MLNTRPTRPTDWDSTSPNDNLNIPYESGPIRQTALYALWFAEKNHIDLTNKGEPIHLEIDHYSGVVYIYDKSKWQAYQNRIQNWQSTSRSRKNRAFPPPKTPNYLTKIVLPYAGTLAMDDWKARCKVISANPNPSKSSTIKVKGITIPKRWNWTKQRERHERDTINQLFKPMGIVKCYLT